MTFISKLAREPPHSGKEGVLGVAADIMEGEGKCSVGGGVRPLSDLYGTGDYIGLKLNRGKPMRRYDEVINCEATFAKDFRQKVKARLIANMKARRFSWKTWTWTPPPIPAKLSEDTLIQRMSSADGAGGRGSEDVVDRQNLAVGPPDVIEKLPAQEERTFEDLLQNFLNNPSISHLNIEGCLCSKEQLLEWALDSQPSNSPDKSLRDIAVQTDRQVESVLPVRHVRDKQQEPQAFNPPQPSQNSSPVPLMSFNPISSASLMGVHPSPSPNAPAPLMGTRPNDAKAESGLSEYDKAVQWKPSTPDQAEAFEQAKKDIYQLLVVGKGCRLRSIFSEYSRVIGETLDLEKLGIPDIKTLLVQMKHMIVLKKSRYADPVYIYADIRAKEFETLAHIAQLVAEQRDNGTGVVPPSESYNLVEIDVRELFAPPRQQQARLSPFQPSIFGPYRDFNSFHPTGYYNPYLPQQQQQPYQQHFNLPQWSQLPQQFDPLANWRHGASQQQIQPPVFTSYSYVTSTDRR